MFYFPPDVVFFNTPIRMYVRTYLILVHSHVNTCGILAWRCTCYNVHIHVHIHMYIHILRYPCTCVCACACVQARAHTSTRLTCSTLISNWLTFKPSPPDTQRMGSHHNTPLIPPFCPCYPLPSHKDKSPTTRCPRWLSPAHTIQPTNSRVKR